MPGFGGAVLRRMLAAGGSEDVAGRRVFVACMLLFAVVGAQSGWVLRPFVGSPGSPPTLFRPGAWGGNVYVAVADSVWRAVAR